MDEQQHSIKAIRDLLQAAFTPQTLRRFLLDQSAFQPLGASLSPEKNLDRMVDDLIDFCRTRLLWEELLAGVKEANPRQFERFQPYRHERAVPDWVLELRPAAGMQDGEVPDWLNELSPGQDVTFTVPDSSDLPEPACLVSLHNRRCLPAVLDTVDRNKNLWGCLVMAAITVGICACLVVTAWISTLGQ